MIFPEKLQTVTDMMHKYEEKCIKLDFKTNPKDVKKRKEAVRRLSMLARQWWELIDTPEIVEETKRLNPNW